ncbi:alpha-xylosidase [Arcanobacterium phocisimile]|uniref:Alpha-xylosidase n=1 Tax=Arcanobacterium phocisimile TaxID=1302235 RepID=A0ABX7IHJ1_9ACTO|nr:glycoside hydrolase family 31 protein [Arcanobacterium phocisimile]QRV02527.1 alpha-xylosidase [Arcanobacterium phocisimile]
MELSVTPNIQSVLTGDSWRVSVISPSCIRFETDPHNNFVDEPTQLVEHRPQLGGGDYSMFVDEGGGHSRVVIETQRAVIYFDPQLNIPQALRIKFQDASSPIDVSWPQDDPGNLHGTYRTLDNIDGSHPLEPGLVSTSGYVLVDDSDSIVRSEDGWIRQRETHEDAQDVYLFVYGQNYHELFASFFALTGRSPLIPRPMLGNWWSRYWRYSDREYRQLLDDFDSHHVPLSVGVLDMDWHITDVPVEVGSGWTGYSWNRELFPDPEGFLGYLHERGMLTSLNVHPADGVRFHEDAYQDMCRELGKEPDGTPVEFNPVDRRFMDAYFNVLHKQLEAQGVDFWWIDWQQGEQTSIPGLDPLWMLNHYHYLNSSIRNISRKAIFSRYAGLGSHRYPIGFSGDAITSWDSLAFQPYFTANAANVGYYWWSHDIGGHMAGIRNNELHTRWVQFGVFSPIMRLHATASPFTSKEPWVFPQPYCDTQISFLQLRHQLIPYVYTSMWQSIDGRAPIRPLYHDYGDDGEAYQHPNTYLFGESMIVVPIVAPLDPDSHYAGATGWLPEGTWYDFFNGKRYLGGQETVFYRDITSYPVLAKAGSIVALATDTYAGVADHPHAVTLRVFLGDGVSELIEDDGGDQPYRYRLHQNYGGTSVHISVQAQQDAPSRMADVELQLMGVRSCSYPGTYEANAYRISLGECDMASLDVHIADLELDIPDIRRKVFEVIDQAEGFLQTKETLWEEALRFIETVESDVQTQVSFADAGADSHLRRVVSERIECYRALLASIR